MKAKDARMKKGKKRDMKMAKLSRKARMRQQALAQAPREKEEEEEAEEAMVEEGEEEALGERVRLLEETDKGKADPAERTFPVKRRKKGPGRYSVRQGGVELVVVAGSKRADRTTTQSFRDKALARHRRLPTVDHRRRQHRLAAKAAKVPA